MYIFFTFLYFGVDRNIIIIKYNLYELQFKVIMLNLFALINKCTTAVTYYRWLEISNVSTILSCFIDVRFYKYTYRDNMVV